MDVLQGVSAVQGQNKPEYDVLSYIPMIIESVSSNPSTSLLAPTGTGKSTRVPVAFARQGYYASNPQFAGRYGGDVNNVLNKVIVAVSSKAVAVSLYTYVSRELQGTDKRVRIIPTKFDSDEIEEFTNDDIIYTTHAYLRSYLVNFITANDVFPSHIADLIILDDIERGSSDIEVIYKIWDVQLSSKNYVPALLTMGTIYSPELFNSAVINIPYPKESINMSYNGPAVMGWNLKVLTAFTKSIISAHVSESDNLGHFMVFVPTDQDVSEMHDELQEKSKTYNFLPVPLTSSATSTEFALTHSGPIEGRRKIFIVSSLIESSITVTGIFIVFDSMYELRREENTQGGYRMRIRPITHLKALERCMRLDPTINGACVRYITEDNFNKLSPVLSVDEARGRRLDAVIDITLAGADASSILASETTYKMASMGRFLLGFKRQFSPNDNSYENFIKQIPFGIRAGSALWLWLQTTNKPAFVAIVICAIIDSFETGYFVFPAKRSNQTREERADQLRNRRRELMKTFGGTNDLHTLLNVWSSAMDEIGGPTGNTAELKNWCDNNHIKFMSLLDVMRIVMDTVEIVRRIHGRVRVGPFTSANAVKFFKFVAKVVWSDSTFRRRSGDDLRYTDGVHNYGIDRFTINTFTKDKPADIIAVIKSKVVATTSDGNQYEKRVISLGI
jgi:hypothetical protein